MGGSLTDDEVPDEIKHGYKCRWWFITLLLITTAICTFIAALNIFGGFIAVVIGIWAWYMVKDDCKNMSQYCMFTFGLMCVMQAVFELIPLCMSFGGRTTRTTDVSRQGDPHAGGMHGGHGHGTSTVSQTYTTTIKTTPFFDESLGWHYNFQSVMMIAAPIVMILAACLANVTYKAYPRSLFDADFGEQQSFGGPQSSYGGRYGGGGGYGGNGASYGQSGGAPYGGGGGGRPLGRPQPAAGPVTFGGSGHTLGRG